LFLPGNSNKAPTEGTVIGVGYKVTEVKLDDRVLFEGHTLHEGQLVVLEGEKLFLLRETEILGVLE